jgi:hypothetical protein
MADVPVTSLQSSATRTPIAPGLVTRLTRALDVIRGNDEAWFGPNQPLQPVADRKEDQTAGRIYDYPVGNNLRTVKRGGAPITFEQLRGLADGYDLLRIVLETRKDQIAKLEWRILPRGDGKENRASKAASEFWQRPDRERDWDAWLRMLVEEMYVTDAATIYPRRTLGGDLWSFDVLDGSTITRMIDATGRMPMPPNPAYQQILKGVPAVDYTSDELLYRPRNPRVWKLYGFSQVEQIITTVNIALRRQINQLSYYTDGNAASLIFGVPETWNPDQIAKMQQWWDDLTGKGRDYRARFIPGGVKPYDTKEQALKDEFDEWLARIVCFAFSIEPTPFVKQTNRATAETARQQSLSEGIVPTMRWIKARIDECLVVQGLPGLEFNWVQEESVDPLVKAQIAQIYVGAKIMTADEARANMGLEPLTPEQKDELVPALPAPASDATAANGENAAETDAEAAKAAMPDLSKKNSSARVDTMNRPLQHSLRY